jgi:hypothetical protein
VPDIIVIQASERAVCSVAANLVGQASEQIVPLCFFSASSGFSGDRGA